MNGVYNCFSDDSGVGEDDGGDYGGEDDEDEVTPGPASRDYGEEDDEDEVTPGPVKECAGKSDC